MKLVILDGGAANPGDLSWDGFCQFGALTVYDRTPQDLAAERIGDAEIVITNKVLITKELLDRCSAIKMICVLATGYNTVDVKTAHARGIWVSNVPSYSTDSVAQLTMALLLEIAMHVGAHHDSVKSGDWVRAADYSYTVSPLVELLGKTMGIIGMGRIGYRVAQLASAFGMKIAYHSRSACPHAEKQGHTPLLLDGLLQQSDVISLHVPLTDQTRGMIDSAAISKMKTGVILLNTTRGAVIEEEAVAAALRSKKVYAYGTDVLSSEPPEVSNPLLTAPNCVITPHIAWATKEARKRLIDTAIQNVQAFLSGTPQNGVME